VEVADHDQQFWARGFGSRHSSRAGCQGGREGVTGHNL
jgi:hypothetical protein